MFRAVFGQWHPQVQTGGTVTTFCGSVLVSLPAWLLWQITVLLETAPLHQHPTVLDSDPFWLQHFKNLVSVTKALCSSLTSPFCTLSAALSYEQPLQTQVYIPLCVCVFHENNL